MSVRQFEHAIRLFDKATGVLPAVLNCEGRYWNEGNFSRRVCTIILRCDRCEVAGEGPDFFDALCRVREALEPHGLIPLCYGASRAVFPSNMARDMGDGLKAYQMRPGMPATRADLVSIFADGPDIEPVTVKAQREFWQTWLQSLQVTHSAEQSAADGGRDLGSP